MKYLKLFESFEENLEKSLPFDIKKMKEDIKDFCIYIEDLLFEVDIKDDIIKEYYLINVILHKNSEYFAICDEVTDCIIQIYEYIMNIARFKSNLYFSQYGTSSNFIVHSYDEIKIEQTFKNATSYFYKPDKTDKQWNRINMEFIYFI